jgi:hypothetical protein
MSGLKTDTGMRWDILAHLSGIAVVHAPFSTPGGAPAPSALFGATMLTFLSLTVKHELSMGKRNTGKRNKREGRSNGVVEWWLTVGRNSDGVPDSGTGRTQNRPMARGSLPPS